MENPRPEAEALPPAPNTTRRILSILCLVPYALLGWLRFSQGLAYKNDMLALGLWPGPRYIIFSGLVIGVAFSFVLLYLLLRARFAPPLTRIVCMLFLGWLWFDHIWLGTREAFHYQLTINVLISVGTLLAAFGLVRDRDYPNIQREKDHDRKQA